MQAPGADMSVRRHGGRKGSLSTFCVPLLRKLFANDLGCQFRHKGTRLLGASIRRLQEDIATIVLVITARGEINLSRQPFPKATVWQVSALQACFHPLMSEDVKGEHAGHIARHSQACFAAVEFLPPK